MKDNFPIGIFDSGLGGLTVFQAVAKLLPHEALIYLGDTARVPYGTKSARTVTEYSLHNSEFLIAAGVKALVVACNTASAYAVPTLRERFALPVLGVIEPGAARAAEATRSGHIGVIGTTGTIGSGAYEQALKSLNPDLKIFVQACPLFVPLVEEGWFDGAVTAQIVEHYLAPLKKEEIDTLILGCTHYPLLKAAIAKEMGPRVTLIDSAEAVAESLATLLEQKGLSDQVSQRPNVATSEHLHSFFVTDSPERFREVARTFLVTPPQEVQLVDIT